MTWATVTIPGSTSTHYYMGTASICLHSSIANDSSNSQVRHATGRVKYCIQCMSLLKSKKIHKVTSRQQRALDLHQKHSENTFGKSLEDMLYNWLEFHSKTRQVSINEFEEFLSKEYPNVASGTILILLLASKKVTVSENFIIPNPVETSYVK